MKEKKGHAGSVSENNMVTIEELIQTAQENGASDVHIAAGISPKMRINGLLTNMEYQELESDEIKQMIQSVISEKHEWTLEGKGEVDFSVSIAQLGRCRINVFKQNGSYAAALHLIETIIPDMQKLHIPQTVEDLYKKKHGLILVTGPAGSGKSTTLTALIQKINQNINAHIITLEEPIEYLYQNEMALISQREIGLDSDTYASALKAARKEDADVILVGEMQDQETILATIMAAEAGHLVFSSLYTIGAVNTIDYIIDTFPPHQQQQIRIRLARVLESVVSQQLISTSNHENQVAIFEVMHMNPTIRNLVREGKTSQISTIMQSEKKQGMMTMDDAIFELYIQGEIDREEALTYAQDISTLEKKLI